MSPRYAPMPNILDSHNRLLFKQSQRTNQTNSTNNTNSTQNSHNTATTSHTHHKHSLGNQSEDKLQHLLQSNDSYTHTSRPVGDDSSSDGSDDGFEADDVNLLVSFTVCCHLHVLWYSSVFWCV